MVVNFLKKRILKEGGQIGPSPSPLISEATKAEDTNIRNGIIQILGLCNCISWYKASLYKERNWEALHVFFFKDISREKH